MRTVIKQTNVYSFDELSEEAKEKARDWWRSMDSWDCEDTIDYCKEICKVIGIDIDKIYFSGFWSQGDGACFEGSYRYKKGGIKQLGKEYPQYWKDKDGNFIECKPNKDFYDIAKALQAEQKINFYRLRASVVHSGRYSHEHCTIIDVEDYENQYRDIGSSKEQIKDLLRDVMRWIYKQLQEDYESYNSNENVDENIRINEYEFTEEGKIYK